MNSTECSGTQLIPVTTPTSYIGMVILFIRNQLSPPEMKLAAEVIRVHLHNLQVVQIARRLKHNLSVLSENERRD